MKWDKKVKGIDGVFTIHSADYLRKAGHQPCARPCAKYRGQSFEQDQKGGSCPKGKRSDTKYRMMVPDKVMVRPVKELAWPVAEVAAGYCGMRS